MAKGIGPKGQAKMAKTMREFASGTLKSGSGKKVTSLDQARAIGMSQARQASRQGPTSPSEPAGNNPATRAQLRTPGK